MIELIIVVLIVGILASIAAPMMQAAKGRAICSEAAAALGTIRTALKAYYAEYGNWPADAGFIINGALYLYPNQMSAMGLPIDNLQGAYFGKECYAFTAFTTPNIFARARPDKWGDLPNSANGALEVSNLADSDNALIRMDVQTGKITQQSMPKSGY